jgi:hypothetical protein
MPLFFAKEKVLLLDDYGDLNDYHLNFIQKLKVVPLIYYKPSGKRSMFI